MKVKVTDRRKFRSDGQLREEDSAAQDQESPTGGKPTAPEPPVRSEPSAQTSATDPPAPPPSTPAANSTPKSLGGSEASPPAKVDFQSFVYFLYMSALQELGIPTQEGVDPHPADLERARFFVDVLELLEEKTRGNLEPGETKLLEEALYNLRMQYLGVSKTNPA